MSDQPLVGVIMGSKSDWETMSQAAAILAEFAVPHETRVVSAHRTPQWMAEYAASAKPVTANPVDAMLWDEARRVETEFLEKNAERGWTSVEDFRGLKRNQIVAQSRIRRPNPDDYEFID